PEAPVTLNCQIENLSEGWRIYWYEAVPDVSPGAYRYELLPESISGTIQKSYMVHGQKHTAGYACRAGRGNPEYFTKYSEPKFVWLADPHPAASLSVSPDREQHFTSESVTLNCGGNSTEWRVMRFSATGHLIYLRICLVMTASLCTINRTHSDKSVYWCESPSGEFSNAVNLTVHDLLLVSPVHPVTEGASVTLSCRRRGENKLSDVIFYHNDKLIQNDSRGELKISAVSQSHEGFYKCEHSGEVSPQSWMRVKSGDMEGYLLTVTSKYTYLLTYLLMVISCPTLFLTYHTT
uniref:Ig-like domain-containing protein n=1 Tax=Poecilia reticulata TaxID=8081 RepID=A0A3P9NMC9_POERE